MKYWYRFEETYHICWVLVLVSYVPCSGYLYRFWYRIFYQSIGIGIEKNQSIGAKNIWKWSIFLLLKTVVKLNLLSHATHMNSVALWFKTALQNNFVVILHVLQFQVQMLNWISFHRPRTWILFTLWFKTALQNDLVVILHDLQFQVQTSNWIFFHRLRTWILFTLWFKTALWYDYVVILHVLPFQV